MVFWCLCCLTSLTDCLLTSNHHRQWCEPVKKKCLCGCVPKMDVNMNNVAFFDAKCAFKGCVWMCSSGSTVFKHCNFLLYTGGFIVLSSAGTKVFTIKNQFLARATHRKAIYETVPACQDLKDHSFQSINFN